MSGYADPAFDPNRTVMGSRTLGRVATGLDAGATELSKLGNGFFLSLSHAVGADNAAKMFNNNVNITSDFQNHIEQADPQAAAIGKYGAIADVATLTTPIWGTSLAKAAVTGAAGAASSTLADIGSNRHIPTSEDYSSAIRNTGVLGAIGALTGNGFLKAGMQFTAKAGTPILRGIAEMATPLASRTTEATVEGTNPENYLPGNNK